MELPIGRYERINYISISLNQELVVATDQGVWINTEEGFQSLFVPLEKEVVTLAEQDRAGNWWIGTVNRGIARLKISNCNFWSLVEVCLIAECFLGIRISKAVYGWGPMLALCDCVMRLSLISTVIKD